MDASDFIAAYRQPVPTSALAQLATLVAYAPGKPEFGCSTDSNLVFRAAVVDALLPDFSLVDYELIQVLFADEMKCEAAIWRHDSLYQLCFYLFELRQLPDVFRLYEAKFEATNMDVGVLLDREMILVGHEVSEVIAYVERVFTDEPSVRARYPKLLAELHGLVEYPDYESCAQYRTGIQAYFYGGEDDQATSPSATPLAPTVSLSGYEPRPKPWWKFW
jgi:hypothetical protein